MGRLIDIAGDVLSKSTQRVEVYAQNISNAATPGYKRRLSFDKLVNSSSINDHPEASLGSAIDFSAGKLVESGNPLDLAILGEGFFLVRGEAGAQLTRQGQFTRDVDGRLITAGGEALQTEAGRDLLVESADFTVAADGLVSVAGRPIDRLAVVDVAARADLKVGAAGGFVAAEADLSPAPRPAIRQGAFEASNVSTGQEMVLMMEAMRRAEAGQRLATIYDDLMGRVLTTLGQG